MRGCPVLALWGAKGMLARWYDVIEVWRGWADAETLARLGGHRLAPGPVREFNNLNDGAVAALLEGFPVKGVAIEGEMVTPTGAALVTGLASAFGPIPDMTVERVAYGAGTREWPDRPNLLRLVLGESDHPKAGMQVETLTVLACNLDDMIPEWYGPLVETALESGALDVWLTPAHMKKGRPAVIVEVLCRPADALRLRDLLFAQTTTLGIREYPVTRYALPRTIQTVETPYGAVRVKIGRPPTSAPKIAPEHDDCAARAAEHGVSVREVWLAAVQAAGDLAG